MMKNDFYFMLKALFALGIAKFLFWLFGYVGQRPDKKVKVNFKIYDDTSRTAKNYNTYIVQYLRKQMQPDYETWSVNRI